MRLKAALPGFNALSDEQRQAIGAVVLGGKDVTAIHPAGFGKSLIMWVSVALLGGIGVLVTPLNIITESHARALEKLGITDPPEKRREKTQIRPGYFCRIGKNMCSS